MLFPISLLYALVVHLRNYCYDNNLFKSKSFGTPIICVGNLSVGGTGKTPMVEFLVSCLVKDANVAVLSRGYRRKSKGFVLADADATVQELGDEPYQIHAKFPEITVAVDADRQNGIAMLEDKIRPDVIILDDAFQHRKVKPSISILLTAYGNLYSDDWYLPTGSLRDSKREAKRADLLVVTKCPPDLNQAEQHAITLKLKPSHYQQVLFSCFIYNRKIKGLDGNFSLESFKNKKITLVTGIANPEPLVVHLEKEGLIFDHLRFNDHHFFTQNELDQLQKKECILTTEKDFVRLKSSLKNIFYISIKHEFLNAGKKILENRLKAIRSPDS